MQIASYNNFIVNELVLEIFGPAGSSGFTFKQFNDKSIPRPLEKIWLARSLQIAIFYSFSSSSETHITNITILTIPSFYNIWYISLYSSFFKCIIFAFLHIYCNIRSVNRIKGIFTRGTFFVCIYCLQQYPNVMSLHIPSISLVDFCLKDVPHCIARSRWTFGSRSKFFLKIMFLTAALCWAAGSRSF